MKIIMKKISICFVLFLLSALFSCSNSDSTGPADSDINPFSNGGDERNMLVVISDIHLGADISYAECNKNRGALEKLLNQIREAQNVKELVIAGDLLDEWFVPAIVDTYQGKNQADFVQRIATTNKGVIDAINNIIQDQNIFVTYVPGNHDLTITAANVDLILPGIHQARDPELGLGTYSPADYPKIAIEHGHRYNFFCAPDPISNQVAAPGTILPPGYFLTRIAALHVVQHDSIPGDTLDVVTKNTSGNESQDLLFTYRKLWEWAINNLPITNKFDENMIVTNVDGFKGNYSVNDLLPHQTIAGGLIYVDLYDSIQDKWDQRQALNNVDVNIPASRAIANSAKSSESDSQAIVQYFLNPKSDKRIVIFGHTHDAKIIDTVDYEGQKAIYANTGTWIDSNNVAPTTMNFVVVTPQDANSSSQTYVRLYNFENEVVTKMDEDSLRY